MIAIKIRMYMWDYNWVTCICLFLYFCGLNAHKLGYGFDAYFCRGSFVLLLLEGIASNKKVRITQGLLWYALFVLFYFVSSFWAVDRSDLFATEILMNFIQIIGVAMVLANCLTSKNQVDSVLAALLWSLVYMVILLIWRTPISAWGTERVGSVMALNPNDIGIRTSVAVVLCLYFSKKHKVYYLLAVVFAAIAFLSGSRKAFIMIIMEVVLYFLGKDRGWKIIKNLLLISLLGFIMMYTVFEIPAIYNVLGIRLERTFNSMLGIQQRNEYGQLMRDYSGEAREEFRKLAMGYFYEHPLLGLGGNGFVTQMRSIGHSHVAYSHCNYTELLSTLGGVGLCIYYSMPLVTIFRSHRYYRLSRDRLLWVFFVIGCVYLFIDFFYVAYFSVFSVIVMIISSQYVCQHFATEKDGFD